ncbi:MAG: hypothetical protein CM15mP120_11210 [Pseudomonadota bacterium]|nr:MAG: hypothetical protein CM15mP120_11210 [Pseudomonadota bacterium]
MIEAKLNQTHKDLLQYFSSMILDPDGHKRWMEEIAATSKSRFSWTECSLSVAALPLVMAVFPR